MSEDWISRMDTLREILISDKTPMRRVANLYRAGMCVIGRDDGEKELLFGSLTRRFGVRHPAVCEVGNLMNKLRAQLLGGISDQHAADAMRSSIMLYLLAGLDGWSRETNDNPRTTVSGRQPNHGSHSQ